MVPSRKNASSARPSMCAVFLCGVSGMWPARMTFAATSSAARMFCSTAHGVGPRYLPAM